MPGDVRARTYAFFHTGQVGLELVGGRIRRGTIFGISNSGGSAGVAEGTRGPGKGTFKLEF